MNRGFVYILSNGSLKGNLLKIGATKSIPSKRSRQLSRSTSIPGEFKLEYYTETENFHKAEKRVHLLLKEFRYSENKEFFSVSISDAVKAVKYVAASIKVQWLFNEEIYLHDDYRSAHFSKALTLTAIKLLLLLIKYSHSNTLIDHIVGMPDTKDYSFLSHSQLAEELEISPEQAKKNMKKFITSYENLKLVFDPGKKVTVFKDIRYGEGEFGWIFAKEFREFFYNTLIVESADI